VIRPARCQQHALAFGLLTDAAVDHALDLFDDARWSAYAADHPGRLGQRAAWHSALAELTRE
jgi:hypothetical protein